MNEATQLSRPGVISPNRDRFSLDRPERNGADPSAASYSYTGEEKQGINLLDYWRVVRKHLWLIFGITVVIPTLVAIYLIRQPDIYESQARIQVDLETANPLLGGMSKGSSVVLSGENNDPAYFNTQLQILTGPGLLRRVVKNLDLEHNPGFASEHSAANSSMWSRVRGVLGFKSPSSPVLPSNPASLPVTSESSVQDMAEAERLSDYVDDLQTTLKVEPVKETRLSVRETRLIDISYRHSDARLAAKIVNTIADIFVAQNLEKKQATSNSTGTYLEKRIAELQSDNRQKEEQLLNYARSHQILSLDANQNTVVDRLAGLNKQLLVAENERKLAESAYRASLQPGAAEALAEGGAGTGDQAPSSTRLNTEAGLKLAELKQKRAELLVENTPQWPAVKEVDKQIAVLEKQISETRSRATAVVTTNLATRYRQALATEEALRKAYDQQRAETLTQNEAAVTYRIIQQEIETNKSLLDGLLQRTKENDVVMAGTPNNIRVVDYAIAQKKPVAPKRTLTVAASLLLSLIFGVALAFLIEYLDDSVRSSEDVEKLLHLPSVAVIPQIGKQKGKRLLAAGGPQEALMSQNGGTGDVLLTGIEKHSPFAEAYRHLRTSILLSTAGRAPRTLLITSSMPSEGKTTTAVNTAMSLAQTGARVLIVDADLRRPRLHSIFNIKNDYGLSSLLSREASDEAIDSAIQNDPASGLFVLTSGPVPPNPAELLGSEQMLKLVAALSPKFGHLVIDSPPIAAFTDGVLIATMVDGVLLVVQSGKSSRKDVTRARKLLLDVGARIIGVVLNKVEAAASNSYYYYSKYYNYSHSEQKT